MKIIIVAADFYPEITAALLRTCRAELAAHNIKPAREERVPGALEIPFALKITAEQEKPDALIALGCVIRGETYHFQTVADICARGIWDVQLQTNIPVGNGVLTVETMEQAKARADKGAAAVRAALALAKIAGGNNGGA